MSKADKYLEKLKEEKEYWARLVEDLPGDAISTTHPYYRMSNHAAAKYAAAKTMMDLMIEGK